MGHPRVTIGHLRVIMGHLRPKDNYWLPSGKHDWASPQSKANLSTHKLTISFGGSFHDRRVTGLLILTVGRYQVGGLKVGRLLRMSDEEQNQTVDSKLVTWGKSSYSLLSRSSLSSGSSIILSNDNKTEIWKGPGWRWSPDRSGVNTCVMVTSQWRPAQIYRYLSRVIICISNLQ